ncbi:MAG: OB-fold domain-containing protein [Acidiferrobacterales bacterium]
MRGPRGTLESFAVVPHTEEELAEAAPVVTYGLIRLEGADTNLAHVLRGESPARLRVGAPVEAVWKEQRTASILDIEHFRLLA